MGAVLIQKGDEGEERIIAYASATFTKEEIKWDVRERECYAAIKFTEYFRPYLVDQPFTLITDHANLKWLMEAKYETGKLARGALRLSQFEFELKVKSGKSNSIPDFLSRCPLGTAGFVRDAGGVFKGNGGASLRSTLLYLRHEILGV